MSRQAPVVIASSIFALFPLGTLATCFPQNPYFYLSRGAYLFVFLTIAFAIMLELFRYAVTTDMVRKRLRRGALGFVITALVMLLVACAYGALEQSWQSVYGTPRLNASGQQC